MAKIILDSEELARIISSRLPASLELQSVTPLDDGSFEIALKNFKLLLSWQAWRPPLMHFELRLKNPLLHRIMDTPLGFFSKNESEYLSFNYPKLELDANILLQNKAPDLEIISVDYQDKQMEIEIKLG